MIYVIRHGETDLNKERRMQGRMGLPLNDYGFKQAIILKNELEGIHFDYIFSSPQERAIQTAEIVTGCKPSIDKRLDVYDLGEADRVLISDLKMSGILPDKEVYEGVEEPSSFIRRVFEFMKELENNFHNQEVHILISGHRCTTGCIGAYFEGVPNDGNILKFSSDTGSYKTYHFTSREGAFK